MRKFNVIVTIFAILMLCGCDSKETIIDFSQPEEETTTFTPVNEEQYYGGYSQVNITNLEGIQNITEADIFLPIPNDAIWDADTKTYTMPNNLVNKNGESFVMTISLEPLPDDVSFSTEANAAKEEIDSLMKQDRIKYSSSGYFMERNTVIKYIKVVDIEEPMEDEEANQTPKKQPVIVLLHMISLNRHSVLKLN